jgi:Xaa-Pro aminopeptidase
VSDVPSADPVLRAERLSRLQSAMRERELEACLLFNEPNIRYATGVSAMPVYAMSTFVRCALVPVEGSPVLFEHANSIHRARTGDGPVRPMVAWEFFDAPQPEADAFVSHVEEAMHDLGVRARTLGVDRLGTPGFLALQRAGFTLVDSAPATQAAREVKTPGEIALMRRNGALVLEMLTAFEAAIAPGVRERDLLAVLADTMLRGGGEYLATNTVCAGPNTNPWRAEATDRAMRPGELVFVDTDTVGIGGYFFCVSRTFAVPGAELARDRRDTYLAARDWLEAMKGLVRPGVTCAELAAAAPPLPDRWLDQRYECMIHGIGLEEESPSVCYPVDPQSNGDRVIEEGMTLVVELYAGVKGADHGVKLGDEVLVTADGIEVLAPYPFGDVGATG